MTRFACPLPSYKDRPSTFLAHDGYLPLVDEMEMRDEDSGIEVFEAARGGISSSAGPGLAKAIGEAAAWALREEAALAPKPGLVDPLHKGAHEDMDFPLLLASAYALEPGFVACAEAGLAYGRGDPRALLPALRPIGIEAERAMLAATGGVNTHKGAIFCLGLLAAAAGHEAGRAMRGAAARRAAAPSLDALGDSALGDAVSRGPALDGLCRFDANTLCGIVGRICGGMVATELGGRLRGRNSGSAGERLYSELGVKGARGEAEAGYPVLRDHVLPALRRGEGLARDLAHPAPGSARYAARLDALLASMAELEDSCLLARGGLEALAFARERSRRALTAGGAGSAAGMKELLDLDGELCLRRWSPGGSADMLAAGIFLEKLEREGAVFRSFAPSAPS